VIGALLQHKLTDAAKRVVIACSEEMLNKDMPGCQWLCCSSMCCFLGVGYSCKEVKGRDCAAYAGCKALVIGVPWMVPKKTISEVAAQWPSSG